eukprot:PhM_4_TR3276/c0_g1_i1/m.106520
MSLSSIVLSFVVVCTAILCVAAGVSTQQSQPPALSDAFTSWVVLSESIIKDNTTTLMSSVGFHVDVDVRMATDFDAMCTYDMETLFPTNATKYNAITMYNGTDMTTKYSLIDANGNSVSCGSKPLAERPRPGGLSFLSPSPELLAKMTFLNYTVVDGHNSSMWQLEMSPEPGVLTSLLWAVHVYDKYPALYVNHTTFSAKGHAVVLTAAYVGVSSHTGFNGMCSTAGQCASNVCIANRAATPDQLGSALGWACSPDGGVDCSPINQGGNRFYPDTVQSHGDYAFNAYYQAHKAQGPGACNFNGAGELVLCDQRCRQCVPKQKVDENKLGAALGWVCGKDALQNCTAIQPGGAHFQPNTTEAHAAWAFTEYYNTFHCVPGANTCDFGGVAELVDCQH